MNPSNNESLHAFRDVVSHVFRLTMASARGDYNQAPDLFDGFLSATVHMLEAKDAAKASAVEMSAHAGETITAAFLAKDSNRDLFEPPYSPVKKSPTLVIYPDAENFVPNQTVIVQKVPSEAKVVYLNATKANIQPSVADVPEIIETEPKNKMVSTSDSEDIEDDDITPDEVDPNDIDAEDIEANDADEDDEEEMNKIKIGRKTYFLGSSTNFVYEYVDDENAGQLLGKYENKKIVPL